MPSSEESDRKVVALVIHSLCFGGAERQVIEMARHLDASKYDAYIITFSDSMPLLKSGDPLRDRVITIRKYMRWDISLVYRLMVELRGLRTDIVHAFLFDTEIVTRFVGKLAGVKLVIGSERNAHYRISAWRRWLLRLTLPLTDLVIANSSAGASFHKKLYGRTQQAYAVVHNGVDTKRFNNDLEREDIRRELGYGHDEIVIGMFASFKPQKNHIGLIKAVQPVMQEYGNLRLLFVGDNLLDNHGRTDFYKRDVLRALEDTGLRGISNVLGNRSDVERLYRACDFTVLPSLHEGMPNVVLESMASGIPVILTDVSDNRNIVRNGVEGFLVDPDDVQGLTQAILKMVADRKLRSRMGADGRATALSVHSNEKMGERLGLVYEQALQRRITN